MQDWNYCSSFLRAKENKLIDYDYLLKLTDSSFPEVFFKLISETYYGKYFNIQNLDKYENIFEEDINNFFREFYSLVPDTTIIDNYKFQYDINNIKQIIKSKLTGTKMEWELLSEYGNISSDDCFTIIEEKLYHKLPKSISDSLIVAEEQFNKTGNIQVIDFIIDSGYFNYQYETYNNIEYLKVLEMFKIIIDLENIKNIIRAKRLNLDKYLFGFLLLKNGNISYDYFLNLYSLNVNNLIEEILKTQYGDRLENGLNELLENNNFSEFEKLIDYLILDYLKNFKLITAGPEVLFEYIFLKKLEVKNLKILFLGKLNSIDAEMIKKRIREVSY